MKNSSPNQNSSQVFLLHSFPDGHKWGLLPRSSSPMLPAEIQCQWDDCDLFVVVDSARNMRNIEKVMMDYDKNWRCRHLPPIVTYREQLVKQLTSML